MREVTTTDREVSKIGRILLANLFQSSRSTFSCVSFPSVFAFQDDMWDTHISARGVRQQYRGVFVKNPVRMHARAGKGSPYLKPSWIQSCTKCIQSPHSHAQSP